MVSVLPYAITFTLIGAAFQENRTSAAISRSLSLCSSGTRPRIVARANSELSAKEESNMTQYNQMQCNTAFTQESHNEHSVDEHHRTVLISILNILC